jgi:hypothetical protein
MYRRSQFTQQKMEMPFGVELDPENRWVKLSKLMPWEKIEELYARGFSARRGQEALPARLAFGALYIKGRLKLSDEETVNQIRENPSMQYFCGYEVYSPAKPFDSSLLVRFRRRLMPKVIKEITAEAGKNS